MKVVKDLRTARSAESTVSTSWTKGLFTFQMMTVVFSIFACKIYKYIYMQPVVFPVKKHQCFT